MTSDPLDFVAATWPYWLAAALVEFAVAGVIWRWRS